MKATILREAGVEEALLGLSLSYNVPLDYNRMYNRALKLSHLDKGHNKFLESIQVWLDITAPRYWWSQFDTYRIGVTKQSESTMHTLMRCVFFKDSQFAEGTPTAIIDALNEFRTTCANLETLKRALPESFLQRRIVSTNYKALKGMVDQRTSHKLSEWQCFIQCLRDGLKFPEFIFSDKREALFKQTQEEKD